MGVVEDIGECKRIEFELQQKTKEQAQLESQIRQAQKMEVLGRLAGGVAHDFNNMLMVLGGCSDLLDRALPTDSPARLYLNQIQRTTEKAAAITKQLLAFSRKQILEMKPMDLHEALTSSEFMLPRLLGSDIELSFQHEAAHSWIVGDASQVEQVIANLAINSRDAMPEGGRLTISTANADRLPEGAATVTTSVDRWVVLSVTDSGCGMDDKTRAQIFEPFFTTKPLGKGTGLGLATVYGIVQQSNGHIHVRTAPGQGTTFEIYFPAVEPVLPPVAPVTDRVNAETPVEATILVVDDESALRHAVVELLRVSGYIVLEAESALDALELAEKHSGIDILLTDIVMPGCRGPELARRVSAIHSRIAVIYMSGYAEGFQEAELPPGAIFLQKPFRFSRLLEQLRLIQGGADRAK
jgi:two-component system, cell cycle sensor histidine kinase and response regulator CckA